MSHDFHKPGLGSEEKLSVDVLICVKNHCGE